ncbi:hypothetical protein ACTXT7_003026 [Hymenolepis weldensis]
MVEVIAPINIALLKYWGKSDMMNIEPVADSISLTLSIEHLHSRTIISLTDDDSHIFRLNGKLHPLTVRMKDVIINSQLRAMQKGTFNRSKHLCIESSNNFPTAAGLASSASGFASMAFGLSHLYQLDCDVASLARRGSGSACRSILGGIVYWKAPTSKSECYSPCVQQLFPHTHWSDLRILICVSSSQQKSVPSSVAMRRTTATSPLFQEARAKVVKERVPQFIHAVQFHDFELLAELTMRESNELHAVCLDSWPPVIYLNATSFAIMEFVHTLNNNAGFILYILRLQSPTQFESESDCKLDQVVFVDDPHCSGYCFYERGFGVMGMLINSLSNHSCPTSPVENWRSYDVPFTALHSLENHHYTWKVRAHNSWNFSGVRPHIAIYHFLDQLFYPGVAYTFDAGPNAFILTQANDAPVVLTLLSECFGNPSHGHEDANGLEIKREQIEMPDYMRFEVRGISCSDKVDLTDNRELLCGLPKRPGAIEYIINTKVRRNTSIKLQILLQYKR